ncbi:MAG: FHA domain-containing protein [Clostridia bacterium]|nr:FHA domain-containing protein [Clostridia bacterium]
MKIRKGPYGYFAVYEIKDMQQVYKYAWDTIKDHLVDGLLCAYDEETRKGNELLYDFSGLINITEQEAINTDLMTKRKAIGDLFNLISKLGDYLLPADNLILDPDYIFFDTDQKKINLCYIPLITETTIDISSLDYGKLERLLSSEFFRSSLSEDEITSLIYSVKSNNEELYVKVTESIMTNTTEPKRELNINKLSFILLMIFSFITLIFSILFLDRICSIILGIIFCCLLVKTLYDHKKDKIKTYTGDLSKDRTQILFEKDPDIPDDNCNLFSFASIESVEDKKAYGIYACETTIGSDRFLSDIYLDDEKISALQAKILKEDNSFFVMDCSDRNNTYLENRALEKEKPYEIKDGHEIRFGDKVFLFKIN